VNDLIIFPVKTLDASSVHPGFFCGYYAEKTKTLKATG
jgi:hypothetical protein